MVIEKQRTINTGLPSVLLRGCVRRADVQTWSLVLLFKFSVGRQYSAPKPARMQSPKPLCAMPCDSVKPSFLVYNKFKQ
ncbi:hypothetical protein DU508_13165 [Pedobacter chinensis]|uniref:Uncharacterized protein n=1 Tax=Pedobacter chinensis TaxID=2282421 RepID=A0A369PWC4_9SPHI|nr:hypothetical protein DU508_13165 [Pedobacter chinensis]